MYYNLDTFYQSLAADTLIENLQLKIKSAHNKLEVCEMEEVMFFRGKIKAWKELIGEMEATRRKKAKDEGEENSQT